MHTVKAAVVLALLLMLISPMPAAAEFYVGGHFGVMLPQKNGGDSELSGGTLPAPSRSSNLNFANSYTAGVRVGHYLESIPWFGLEAEGFYATPHFKQQGVTAYPSGTAAAQRLTLRGQTAQLGTVAANLMFRVIDPRFRLKPYAGIGPAMFFARLHDGLTEQSRHSTRPGINAKIGTGYYLAQHVELFGEYRFNYVRLNIDPATNLIGISTNFIAHTFALGVNFHF